MRERETEEDREKDMKISIKEGDMKNLINKMRRYVVIQSIPLYRLHLYSQTIKIVEAC